MSFLQKIGNAVISGARRIASLSCLLLVFLTIQQVIARYFFSAGSIALQELEWHLFGIAILFSFAHTLREDKHIRVDLLYSRFSKKTKRLIHWLTAVLVILPAAGILSYYGYRHAKQSYDFDTHTASDFTSSQYFEVDSFGYSALSPLEATLRDYVIRGEASADPDGLGARWIMKGLIPVAFLLLLLQALLTGLKEEERISEASNGGVDGD